MNRFAEERIVDDARSTEHAKRLELEATSRGDHAAAAIYADRAAQHSASAFRTAADAS